MAAVTDAQVESVRAIVGWVLRTDSADLPWHRVVPASSWNYCAPKVC